MGAGDGVVSAGTRITEEMVPGDGKSFAKTGDKVRSSAHHQPQPTLGSPLTGQPSTHLADPCVCPRRTAQVVVHYTGCLAETGRCFDSSRARGHAFTFPIGCGKVIKGWDTLLLKCSRGARVSMHIAAADAYGPAGHPPNVPRNADLVFDVELLHINEPLVQEGIRFKREVAENARREEDEKAASAEAARQSAGGDGTKRARGGGSGIDSDSSSSSFSSSESSGAARKRKKREKKEKKEKKERKKERKKEKKSKKGKDGKSEKSDRKKEKKHRH